MVKKFLFSLLIIFLVISSLVSFGDNDTRPRVIDNADLFTAEEIVEIESLIKEVESKHNINLIVATADDVGGKSSEAYIDDLYGQVIGDNVDGTGILIDMDNRQVHITTAGSAIPVMDDDRIDETLDAVIANGLKSGEYALGIKTYISMVDDFFVKGPKDNNIIKPREERKYDLFDAALSSVVSLISGFGFFRGVKKGYKVKGLGYIYSVYSHSKRSISGPDDQLIDEHVTTRIIPKRTSRGSGGGGSTSTTHTSGSGGTFGGGGKGF